jgi:hypothetical protein
VEREREVQRAIAADRRLPRRPDGDGDDKATRHEPDARYAYLTQAHD